jgi:hypothetical protein
MADLEQRLDEAHAELVDALRGEVEPERTAFLVARMASLAADAVSGTCRKHHDNGGYADLRPVYDDDGLRYCCTGRPQHCTHVIVE